MIVRHKKNKHSASLWNTFIGLFYSMFTTQITICFNNYSKYCLRDENKMNWNKIVGKASLRYDLEKGHKDSDMLVWRYNPKLNKFQIASYWRNNYSFQYDIIATLENNEPYTLIKKFNGFRPTTFWFGGSQAPNKDLEYQIKFNICYEQKNKSNNRNAINNSMFAIGF